jgi:hypothetical protein
MKATTETNAIARGQRPTLPTPSTITNDQIRGVDRIAAALSETIGWAAIAADLRRVCQMALGNATMARTSLQDSIRCAKQLLCAQIILDLPTFALALYDGDDAKAAALIADWSARCSVDFVKDPAPFGVYTSASTS